MENYKKIFLDLFNAKSSEGVFSLIEKNSILKNQNNWSAYGGIKSNFAIFENQQPDAIPALIEKIINSIDSILIKECHLKGIDPKSSKAPPSMFDATETFFNIKNGNLEEITSEKRKSLAKNIQVIATGDKKEPDILIFDSGEGQKPEDFSNTFLSLNRGNKNSISFVQGKFNMGSTGAVVFCKKPHCYQLIASRKNEHLSNVNAKKNYMGFTLVRRHIFSEKEKSQKYRHTWYEYFCPNNLVPSFDISDGLDLGLYKGEKFKNGAIVKLYSYEIPKGHRGTIRGRIYHEFNQLLYSPALPFLIIERRNYPKSGDKEALVISGNRIRLSDQTERNLIEKQINIKFENQIIGCVKVDAILLNKFSSNEDRDKRKNFIGKNSIIFTLNGQVHGVEDKNRIAKWGFPYLKDHLLIHIDCSRIDSNFRQDLFMANRVNLKQSNNLRTLLDELSKQLKSNEELQTLHKERKRKILQGDSQNETELINNILSKGNINKELKNLLKKNLGLRFKQKKEKKKETKNDKKKKHKKTSRFPSIFKVNLKEKNGKKVKGIPLGGKGTISFETDVDTNYLYRSHEKGEVELRILGHKRNNSTHPSPKPSPSKVVDLFNVSTSQDNYAIKITFEPNKDLSIGDEIEISAKLTSPCDKLEAIFYVLIDKKGISTKEITKKSQNDLNLPKLIKIKRLNNHWVKSEDESPWEEEDWDDDSIVRILFSENEIDGVAVNIDSNALKKYISSQKPKSEEQLKFIKDKYTVQMYLNAIFLFNSIEKEFDEGEENRADFVSKLFKKYGDALLYIDVNSELLKYFD